jgi:hypothetical protein
MKNLLPAIIVASIWYFSIPEKKPETNLGLGDMQVANFQLLQQLGQVQQQLVSFDNQTKTLQDQMVKNAADYQATTTELKKQATTNDDLKQLVAQLQMENSLLKDQLARFQVAQIPPAPAPVPMVIPPVVSPPEITRIEQEKLLADKQKPVQAAQTSITYGGGCSSGSCGVSSESYSRVGLFGRRRR